MIGTCQSSPLSRGRSILALSTLALLAFCCLPLAAFGSSAGIQYQDAPPTSTGKPPSEQDHDGGPSSTSGVDSPKGKSNAVDGDSSDKSSDDKAGGAATKGNGGSGGDGTKGQQGSQAKDNKNASGDAKPASSTSEPGSDDGGTSPLVLIAIAILVLGLGSVAYLAIKRRRDEESDSSDSSDSSVTPEAS